LTKSVPKDPVLKKTPRCTTPCLKTDANTKFQIKANIHLFANRKGWFGLSNLVAEQGGFVAIHTGLPFMTTNTYHPLCCPTAQRRNGGLQVVIVKHDGPQGQPTLKWKGLNVAKTTR
jgi:hypothetical protein